MALSACCPGSKGASSGVLASMKLDYRHQDEAVILSYANGDTCPPASLCGKCGVSVPSRHGIRHGSRRNSGMMPQMP